MVGCAMVMMWHRTPKGETCIWREGFFCSTDLKYMFLWPWYCLSIRSVRGCSKPTVLWWRRGCETSPASKRWLKLSIWGKQAVTLICCLFSCSLQCICSCKNNSIFVCLSAEILRSSTISFISPIIWLIAHLYLGCSTGRSHERQSIPYPTEVQVWHISHCHCITSRVHGVVMRLSLAASA